MEAAQPTHESVVCGHSNVGLVLVTAVRDHTEALPERQAKLTKSAFLVSASVIIVVAAVLA